MDIRCLNAIAAALGTLGRVHQIGQAVSRRVPRGDWAAIATGTWQMRDRTPAASIRMSYSGSAASPDHTRPRPLPSASRPNWTGIFREGHTSNPALRPSPPALLAPHQNPAHPFWTVTFGTRRRKPDRLDSHIRDSAWTSSLRCAFMPRASRQQAPIPPREHWSGHVATTRTRSRFEAGRPFWTATFGGRIGQALFERGIHSIPHSGPSRPLLSPRTRIRHNPASNPVD